MTDIIATMITGEALKKYEKPTVQPIKLDKSVFIPQELLLFSDVVDLSKFLTTKFNQGRLKLWTKVRASLPN